MSVADRLTLEPEVAAALAAGRPVVALESTLISHGLPYPAQHRGRAGRPKPRSALPAPSPATVAIRDGRLLVGLTDGDLVALGDRATGLGPQGGPPDLAAALAGAAGRPRPSRPR